MDISGIKPITRTIEIMHPDQVSGPVGIRVTLVSIDDPKMTKIKRSLNDKTLTLQSKGKHLSYDDIQENRNEVLYNAMTGWEWYEPEGGEQATYNGEIPDFNRKNVMDVLRNIEWFKDQVETELAETKSFFTNSN